MPYELNGGDDKAALPPSPRLGLFCKYRIAKTDGSPVNEDALYYVLRLDQKAEPLHRKASLKGIKAYAKALRKAVRKGRKAICPDHEKLRDLAALACDIRKLVKKLKGSQ
jgi:hypothetical protein